jgi:phage baseplate assembly protein W
MAIKLKSLERIAKTFTQQSYLYKDLALDLSISQVESPGNLLPVPGADIKAAFDLGAIRNSLQNLFNTKPTERFLFPEYGLNLDQFLFSSITEANANVLGNKIFTTINIYEPRVKVKNVQVIIDSDNNQYLINIYIDIPVLKIQTTIETLLDLKRQSFIVLNTSKNK